MSLNWNWNGKMGELVVKYRNPDEEEWKEYGVSLYEGNAFLIMLDEFEKDGSEMYKMWSFWVDEDHAKRTLGLDKKDRDTYGKNMFATSYMAITKIRINKAKSRNWKKIIKLMSESFDSIQIELYTEGGE